MGRLRALRERYAPNLRTSFHSWQFWLAEVVGGSAVSTVAGVLYGPAAAFFGLMLALVAIAGLVAVADAFPGERNPKRFALLGGGFCLIVAAGMAAGYSAGRTNPQASTTESEPELPRSRPELRLEAVNARVDFEQRTLLVGIKNYGERIASEGRVFFAPASTGAGIEAWPFVDLAPGENQNADFHLRLTNPATREIRGLEQWVDYRGIFLFDLSACYTFEGREYFTTSYQFTCSTVEFVCRYQTGPRQISGPCLENKENMILRVRHTDRSGSE